MRKVAAPALMLAALAGAQPAAADIGGLPDGLALTARGEVLYDSNEIRSSALGVAAGGHRDDYRYSPGATLTYGRSSGRLSLATSGTFGRDYFQYNKYLDRNRYAFTGALTYHRGSSCQASVNGSYSQRQGGIRGTADTISPADDIPPDDTGVIVNNPQTSVGYGASANCGSPSGRLSFGGGYSHASYSNGLASRRFADSDSDSYLANVGIGILRPGQLALNGSYSTIAYPNRVVPVGLAVPPGLLTTGVHTYRVGISFNRPIGTRLSGSIGASYLHSDTVGGSGGYSAPAYNVGLSYTGNRLTLSLNGARNVIASTSSGAAFRVVDTIGLNARYDLNTAWSVNANAGFSQNDYKQSFALLGEPARRRDTTKNVGLNITYAPRSLYDVAFFVGHSTRNSDPSVLNYGSTRASVTLAVHI